jgi:hypothetical protein
LTEEPDRLPIPDHLRLAGFALAHALGSIDGGHALCTLAFVDRDGDRRLDLVRYPAASIADSVATARSDLRTRTGSTGIAALVYDGYVTMDRVRSDALIVDLVMPDGTVVANLIQRYRPGRFSLLAILRMVGIPMPGGLRVVGEPIADPSLDGAGATALWEGLREHRYGRKAYRHVEP